MVNVANKRAVKQERVSPNKGGGLVKRIGDLEGVLMEKRSLALEEARYNLPVMTRLGYYLETFVIIGE